MDRVAENGPASLAPARTIRALPRGSAHDRARIGLGQPAFAFADRRLIQTGFKPIGLADLVVQAAALGDEIANRAGELGAVPPLCPTGSAHPHIGLGGRMSPRRGRANRRRTAASRRAAAAAPPVKNTTRITWAIRRRSGRSAMHDDTRMLKAPSKARNQPRRLNWQNASV